MDAGGGGEVRDTDVVSLLKFMLAEAHNQQDRNSAAQHQENLRCVSVFNQVGGSETSVPKRDFIFIFSRFSSSSLSKRIRQVFFQQVPFFFYLKRRFINQNCYL